MELKKKIACDAFRELFGFAKHYRNIGSARKDRFIFGMGVRTKVGHSGVRIGVRMYPLETRELAVEAVAAGFSLTEAAELAGCSRTAVVNWAKAAGVAPPPRKKAVYLPFDRKMELVARLEAGERAADLAAEAGVTAAAVSGWRRRLREEGALSLMTDSDIAARAPEPREAPSELEELRARCEELELRNAVLEGTIDILKKDPGADLSALTAAERAALADRLRGRFGLRAALAGAVPAAQHVLRPPGGGLRARPVRRPAAPWSGPPSRRPGAPTATGRVRAELARGAGAPQRARGAAGLDPARPVAVSEKVGAPGSWPRRGCAPAPRGRPATAPTPARRAARRRPTCCWSTPAATCTTSRPPPPARSWSPDITEFRLPDDPRKVYLSPAVDLFDGRRRRLLGGHLAVQGARGRDARRRPWPPPGAASRSHSDRGWHYRTPDWVRACGEAGVERSMSRKGTRRTTPPARGSSAGSRSSSSTGGTGAGSPPSGFAAELAEWIRWYREGRLKAFDEGGRKVYDTIAGRRRRLGLAA